MKKAFISGTMNQKIGEEVRKLLSVIDYEGVALFSSEREIPLEVKKERIKMLLDCDVFVTRNEISGPNQSMFEEETSMAIYLGLPFVIFGPAQNFSNHDKRLNDLISDKVLEDLKSVEDDANYASFVGEQNES